MKHGREMKLCDPMNIGMFKNLFIGNKKPRYKGGMCVHVTDKENTVEDENWYVDKFLCPDDQHPSESSVFLQQTASFTSMN